MDKEHLFDPEGRSDHARRLRVLARSIARARHPVLIGGEIGVGKLRFARLLHELGDRPNWPFRRVCCSEEGLTLPPIWSDLSGGGTIVFERIEEAPPAIQRALARSLGSPSFERGAIRLLATTRKDLAVEVLEGRFFSDLYFRLRVQMVEIPPLRDRRDDIPVIARSILEELTKGRGVDPPEMTSEALDLATQYLWPGNIRQLRNELLRCVSRAQHTIGRQLLAEGLDDRLPPQTVRDQSHPMSLRMRVGVFEMQLIEEMLRSTNGNRERTAVLLGVTRRTLQRKIAAARRKGQFRGDPPGVARRASEPVPIEEPATTPPAREVELVHEPLGDPP